MNDFNFRPKRMSSTNHGAVDLSGTGELTPSTTERATPDFNNNNNLQLTTQNASTFIEQDEPLYPWQCSGWQAWNPPSSSWSSSPWQPSWQSSSSWQTPSMTQVLIIVFKKYN